jgi:hypothetical protein
LVWQTAIDYAPVLRTQIVAIGDDQQIVRRIGVSA